MIYLLLFLVIFLMTVCNADALCPSPVPPHNPTFDFAHKTRQTHGLHHNPITNLLLFGTVQQQADSSGIDGIADDICQACDALRPADANRHVENFFGQLHYTFHF